MTAKSKGKRTKTTLRDMLKIVTTFADKLDEVGIALGEADMGKAPNLADMTPRERAMWKRAVRHIDQASTSIYEAIGELNDLEDSLGAAYDALYMMGRK